MSYTLTTYYQVLGLHLGCTIEDLEKAYHIMTHELHTESDSSGVKTHKYINLAYNAVLNHIQGLKQDSIHSSRGESQPTQSFPSGKAHCYVKQVRSEATIQPPGKPGSGFPRPEGPSFGFLHNAGGQPAISRWGRLPKGSRKATGTSRGSNRSTSTSFSGRNGVTPGRGPEAGVGNSSTDATSSPHSSLGTSVYLTEVLRDADRHWKDAHGHHVPLSAYVFESLPGMLPTKCSTKASEPEEGITLPSDLDFLMEETPEKARGVPLAEGSQSPRETTVVGEEKTSEMDGGHPLAEGCQTPRETTVATVKMSPLLSSPLNISSVIKSFGTITSIEEVKREPRPEEGKVESVLFSGNFTLKPPNVPTNPAGNECLAPDAGDVRADDVDTSKKQEELNSHPKEPLPSHTSVSSRSPSPTMQGVDEASQKRSESQSPPAPTTSPPSCKHPQDPNTNHSERPLPTRRVPLTCEDTRMDSLIQERRILKKMLFLSQHCPEPADIALMDDVDLYALLSMFEETTQRLRSVWKARMQRGVEFGQQCVRCKSRPRQGMRATSKVNLPGAGKTGAHEGIPDNIELCMEEVRLACGDEHMCCMCISCAQTATRCPICGAEQVLDIPA
ncbi:unnamed protein product [Phytomonas sp. Hart1]|nr:unnamed protein product [Phytomonas sp. Hart1]|eukprot:CCW70265.1 unnamed protein product [Phytomonas sp. isolate Hart1]